MQTSSVDSYQHALSEIIRKKAVGPKGSRSLKEEDLDIVIPAMASEDVTLVSKAVIVASVIILEQNRAEQKLLARWKSGEHFLPEQLMTLFFGGNKMEFQNLLTKVLNGKDLNAKQARSAIEYLWSSDIPDYEKGVFLIGERLKRESFEENSSFLQAMRQTISNHQVDVPLLIDLADPYDGFRRYPIYTPFVAALLAAMGIPVYCHGIEEVAPKYGDTIHKVLDLAGKDPLKNADSVTTDIENDAVGWGYLDQSVYFPEMYGLANLRDKIVKRTFLATLEKLLQPLQSEQTNYMITGYVHSHYKQELANLLKDRQSLDKVFIVKGMEGSTQSDFRKRSENIVVQNGGNHASMVEDNPINYPEEEWNQCSSLAEYTLETGISALKGGKNAAHDIMINQAVQILGSLEIMEPNKAKSKARQVLDSGRAYRHWQNGCN